MRIGWCPGIRSIPDMLALYPDSSAVRVFFAPGEGLPTRPWSDPAWPNPRQRLALLPAGCTVIVSHKDQGVNAAAFVQAWLAARPDVLLILVAHHEPEQQTGGDPTPAEFRASWTRQRLQVGGHPARADGRLRLAVCYTLQWIRAGGDWRTWWPEHEADAVDLVLFDSYQYEPGAPNPYRPRAYEDPASAIAPMTAIVAEVGRPWGIAEIDHLRITCENGFAVDLDPMGETCAIWYRAMFAAAKDAGCVIWCHFHARHGDLTGRLPEQAALRDLIAQEATMTRVTTLGGHPIEQHTSPNAGGTMSGHKGIVLHIAEGTYQGTISWQMNPDQRYGDGTSVTTSSTWIVGRNTGEWAQMVDTDRIAWCQRGGSRDWLSIELAGHAPDAPTAWQIEACAQLLAWTNQRYGVPLAVAHDPSERGLGHHSMDREWLGEEWGHDSCPGTGVINAKSAIVARAKAIVAGEDTIMSALTDAEQRELLTRLRSINTSVNVTAYRVDAVVGNKSTYNDQMGNTTAPNRLAAALAAIAAQGEQIRADLAARAAEDAQRDTQLAAKLDQLTQLVHDGQTGKLPADEVLRRMGEILIAGTAATPQG